MVRPDLTPTPYHPASAGRTRALPRGLEPPHCTLQGPVERRDGTLLSALDANCYAAKPHLATGRRQGRRAPARPHGSWSARSCTSKARTARNEPIPFASCCDCTRGGRRAAPQGRGTARWGEVQLKTVQRRPAGGGREGCLPERPQGGRAAAAHRAGPYGAQGRRDRQRGGRGGVTAPGTWAKGSTLGRLGRVAPLW